MNLTTPDLIYAKPDDVRRKGGGLQIACGWQETSLGEMLLARTSSGICWLGFANDEGRAKAEELMRLRWPKATFVENEGSACETANTVMDFWKGRARLPFSLHLFGTAFQYRVWQAMLRIPFGRTTSYREIASGIGAPKACRAVGAAVGANPVSLIIPCHRVLPSSGETGNYLWGVALKKKLLEKERASL